NLRVRPVGVIVVDVVACVGHDQAQLVAPGDADVHGLGGRVAQHDAAVEQQNAVGGHLEHDRAVATDLVVDSDLCGERGAGAVHRVAYVRNGVGAEALGVNDT